MEIILLEQQRKLGNIGDVVKVKNGYARNFLIPNNKALRATKENIALFESKKSDIEKENKKKVEDAEKVAKKIEGAIITLVRQAGEDGRLYGSVNASDIANALVKTTKEAIDRKQIVLNNPIKYIGIHSVEVSIYGSVVANIHPNISRSEGEAKDTAKKFVKGEAVMEGPSADGHQQQDNKSEQEELNEKKAIKEEKEIIEKVEEKPAKKAKKETAAKKSAKKEN